MKRTLQTLLSLVVVAASLASCAKETLKENSIPAGEKIQVAVSGSIGEFVPANGATKANAGSVVKVTWTTGDKVFVYDLGRCLGSLDVTPNVDNPSHALLSGTITASLSTSTSGLSLVYVKGATEAPAINDYKISIDISSQSETAVADVPFVLYATIPYDAEKLTKENEFVPFSFATSVMTVNCTTLPTGADNAKIDITKAEIDGVSTVCELTVDGTGVTAVAGTTPGTITRTAGFEQADSRGSFKLSLAADPAAPEARRILVFQDSKVSGAAFTSTTLAEGNSYNTVYQMEEYVIPRPPADALSGTFTVADDGNGNVKKVYFSTGNLYAKKTGDNWTWHFYDEQYQYNSQPTSSGSRSATDADDEIDLFTWGYSAETSCLPTGDTYVTNPPYTRDRSPLNSSVGGDDWGVAYCESNGMTVGTWRTLTIKQWDYLFNTRTVNGGTGERYSYLSGITYNGKKGTVLYPDNYTGAILSKTEYASLPEGVVFLPAAGQRDGSEVSYVGSIGYYWSSDACLNVMAYAVILSSSADTDDNTPSRSYGQSVRLVTDAASDYFPVVKVTGVSLDKSKITIDAGTTETLVATVSPVNAANIQVNWSSSDTSVATVDATGKVSGIAEGLAVITATTVDGKFTAVCPVTVTIPASVLSGVFSVSDTKQVHFSQGNLTYDIHAKTWKFCEHQYDYERSDDIINLFTWGYDKNYSTDDDGRNFVSTPTDDGETLSPSNDWGFAFGGEISIWRTLTIDEWCYLFSYDGSKNGRPNYDNEKRRGKYACGVTVCGKTNCVVLLPDNWEWKEAVGSDWQKNENDVIEYSETTAVKWSTMEKAGAVCLPAAGYRELGAVYTNSYYHYWSSTAAPKDDKLRAYCVTFDVNDITFYEEFDRSIGLSVRLVTESK